MEEKKYELVPSDKEGLYRIKALRDFGNVREGEIGGYISGEHNLSHEGNCWVSQDAIVKGNARVCDNAHVYDNAEVSGNACVYGNAGVYGYVMVFENAGVSGNAKVLGNALVHGHAQVFGNATIYGDSRVGDNAKVYGTALVNGYASIYGDALIKKTNDYLVIQNTLCNERYINWTRSNNMWNVGCFYGTGEELITKAYTDGEFKGKVYEAAVNYVNELLKAEQELHNPKS